MNGYKVYSCSLQFFVVVLPLLGDDDIKKPIIIFMRAFGPVGEVTANCNLLKFQAVYSDGTETWTRGDKMVVITIVSQRQTGAKVMGTLQCGPGAGGPVPTYSFVLTQ